MDVSKLVWLKYSFYEQKYQRAEIDAGLSIIDFDNLLLQGEKALDNCLAKPEC